MKIDKKLLDELSVQANESPRLRMHFDLRDSDCDTSQRILNAVEIGTVMPIHCHKNSSETIIVIRGSIKEFYYNENYEVIETIELNANGPIFGLSIPKNQLHNFEVIEPNTVIISFKNGKYEK